MELTDDGISEGSTPSAGKALVDDYSDDKMSSIKKTKKNKTCKGTKW
jgi:hypothetical protein